MHKYVNNSLTFLSIGWDEGFASMKKGEKCHLRCREDYAYGSQPPGAGIPPNATLNFDVELLGFGPKKKEKWEMSDEEKTNDANQLKAAATECFKAKDFENAVKKYHEAADLIDEVASATDIWVACKLNIAQVNITIYHICWVQILFLTGATFFRQLFSYSHSLFLFPPPSSPPGLHQPEGLPLRLRGRLRRPGQGRPQREGSVPPRTGAQPPGAARGGLPGPGRRAGARPRQQARQGEQCPSLPPVLCWAVMCCDVL
jgi:hypothetical protein